jgi:putative flavoprotein involved in K+ transport
VQRVRRAAGAAAGAPTLEGGQRLEVENVIWCTGYSPGLDWIHLPVFDAEGRPRQYRGVVDGELGLYFAGLAYQYAASSATIYGVSRDARRVAARIAERVQAAARC